MFEMLAKETFHLSWFGLATYLGCFYASGFLSCAAILTFTRGAK